MTRDKGTQREPRRKPYEAPVLTKVRLKPEEAVLGVCKTSNTAGALGVTCNVSTPCSLEGS